MGPRKRLSSSRRVAGLVSVIIATRDRPQQLLHLLKSVRMQTYKRIETILVNGPSATDISNLRKYSVKQVIRTDAVGRAAALNEGFLKSRGEFAIFPDDDMELQPTMIGKLASALTGSPSKAYAYCGFREVEGKHVVTVGPAEFDWRRLALLGNYISAASLIRTDKFVNVGMFDPSLKRLIDYDLWLSFLERGEEGVLVPEILFNHIHLGGPRMSSEDNPLSLPYAVALQLFEWKHSALIESLLKASDPLGMLLQLYWMRKDLQDEFPEVRDGKYHRLIGWAAWTNERILAIERNHAWYSNPTENDPISVLLGVYYMRPDLRREFPEVETGDYGGLLKWASSVTHDSSSKLLAPYMLWYRDKPISSEAHLQSLCETLDNQIKDEKAQTIQLEKELKYVQSELETIKSSFGFGLMCFYGSRIDRILRDGTKRGAFKNILKKRIRIASSREIRSLASGNH